MKPRKKNVDISEVFNDSGNIVFKISLSFLCEEINTYATVSETQIRISIGENKNKDSDSLPLLIINLTEKQKTDFDIIHFSKVKENEDDILLSLILGRDTQSLEYLKEIFSGYKTGNRIKQLQNINPLENYLSSHRISFIILLDQLISRSFDKSHLSQSSRLIVQKLKESYLGNFLIKRLMYFKYRESGSSVLRRKVIEEYYSLLTENKLEEYYPPYLIAQNLTYWFPHPETEIMKVVKHLEQTSHEHYRT